MLKIVLNYWYICEDKVKSLSESLSKLLSLNTLIIEFVSKKIGDNGAKSLSESLSNLILGIMERKLYQNLYLNYLIETL